MNNPDDPTTVLEFLQGSAAGPVLGITIPEPPSLPAIPDFLALPPIPALPPNAAESLLQGIALPALPGLEQLLTPLIDLAQSLGSGIFSGVDPVNVLNQASTLIDQASGLSTTGLADVSQTWNGEGKEAAAQSNEAARRSGTELSERGKAISTTTAAAAESVQRGNIELAAIAQSFAATVVAAAPIALTPPGQAALLAAAAEHMHAAIAAVNKTRSEMLAHTATMNSLAGSIPVPTPPVSGALATATPVAEQVAQFAKTVMAELNKTSMQSNSATNGSGQTNPLQDAAQTAAAHAAAAINAGSDKLWGTGTSLAAAGSGSSPHLGTAAGSGGSVVGANAGGGTFGASAGGRGAGNPGMSAAQSVPIGGSGGAGAPMMGMPPGAAQSAGPTGGMMGGARGATARQGRGDDDPSRTTPGYLIEVSDNNAVIGTLPPVAPAVIGSQD